MHKGHKGILCALFGDFVSFVVFTERPSGRQLRKEIKSFVPFAFFAVNLVRRFR
jgi:hypothetical protein